ncbi:MAG: preprotein translocase subunit SecA [Bacteroidota bacterium]|jgi:preprotein translocase subunit SecA
MLNFISKIFGGSKTEKDVKELRIQIQPILQAEEKIKGLSIDELRHQTIEFRNKIKNHLTEIDAQISDLKLEAESVDFATENKEAAYKQLDELKKTRDEKIEEALAEIMPEAFAVVKEAAKRLSENASLTVTATEHDKNLATKKSYVKINGDKAVWSNSWEAAGNLVTWNMVHYDVQLIGGLALHQGKIAEMATGEGKTLVSTLPAYLNALAGEGVHIVTVNDYLARRDQEWNGPLFEFLQLTVDCIDKHQPNSEERRNAYMSDIVWGTNNEFGFDYLRDNMVHSPDEMVQRKHHYAMVDEVDSVLIDDARTPLIISGPVPKGDDQEFHTLKPRIQKVVDVQRRVVNQFLNDAKKLIAEGKTDEETGGLALLRAFRGLPKNSAIIKYLSEQGIRQVLQKTENFYLQEQQKNMPKVDAELFFTIDEKNNQVELTEKGVELITESGEDPHFFVMPDVGGEVAEIEKSTLNADEKLAKKDALIADFAIKSDRIHTVTQLLKAYTVFEKDVEYVVMDGKVKIVDEQTGRVLEGRRYSDGLHQAIEAKENVKVEAATQTFATITLQNYFRMYHKLAGMTGTAVTEAGEFWEIYKLDVVTIPTHRNIIRKDDQDFVYKTKKEKYNAVIDEIQKLSAAGRPILVGTTSVEVSELLSRMLKLRNIKHNVLNAKQHQREAQVIAEAGLSGNVTIATNMAGRGTDIKLGEGVKDAGGLAIIGTERHESRRVDRQLRGRAGRQGDPGSSQFFVSLEDDLMRLFGSERIAGLMDKLGYKEGEVIQHSMITKSIERAQTKVEENHFGTRKRLLEYDDVMNKQRNVIYTKRHHALFGERLNLDIDNSMYDLCSLLISQQQEGGNYNDFKLNCMIQFSIDPAITEEQFKKANADNLAQELYHEVKEHYARKNAAIAAEALPVLQNIKNGQPQIENVVVPFTDGKRGFNITCNLNKVLETKGAELITEIEKAISLFIIDDQWKEHLRQMDDLKQSVQAAVFEQKDPLLIYKFEAFEMFNQMLAETNKEILSFLCKCHIHVENEKDVKQAREPQRTDMSKMKTQKDEFSAQSEAEAANQQAMQNAGEKPKQTPIVSGPKVGRNDPCPCGSGKKFKSCHGKEELA